MINKIKKIIKPIKIFIRINRCFGFKYYFKKIFGKLSDYERIKINIIVNLNYEEFESIKNQLNDKQYIELFWILQQRKKFNFKHPKGFNEKLRWMQLNYDMEKYYKICDKILSRNYVIQKLGEEYKNILVPIFGIYNTIDEINYTDLPEQFVIKCSHNSGIGTFLCLNKSSFDFSKFNVTQNELNNNYYYMWRERQYKKIEPKIIIERYIEGITNYKFFCFNGRPEFLYVTGFNEKNHDFKDILYCTCMSLQWKKLNFKCKKDQEHITIPKKPINLDKMIYISKILSSEFPFARIDLYEADGKLYFSEITLTPGSGFDFFEPKKYEYKIGKMLQIKKNYI